MLDVFLDNLFLFPKEKQNDEKHIRFFKFFYISLLLRIKISYQEKHQEFEEVSHSFILTKSKI
jgi:hypothetical protein